MQMLALYKIYRVSGYLCYTRKLAHKFGFGSTALHCCLRRDIGLEVNVAFFEPLEKNKCSYVLLYKNSSKAEKIRKWKGGYMELETGRYGRIICVPETSQIACLPLAKILLSNFITYSTGILRMLQFTKGQLNFLQVCVQFIYNNCRKFGPSCRYCHWSQCEGSQHLSASQSRKKGLLKTKPLLI